MFQVMQHPVRHFTKFIDSLPENTKPKIKTINQDISNTVKPLENNNQNMTQHTEHDEQLAVTKNSTETEKLRHLRNTFYNLCFKSMQKQTKSTIENLEVVWNSIRENLLNCYMFDADYLFDIYSVYMDHQKIVQMTPLTSISLALFLQRIGGIRATVDFNADLSYQILREKLGMFVGISSKVRNLILSLKTIDHKLDFEENIYRDLNLYRIGLPAEEYMRYQHRIDQQRSIMALTRLEHFKIKLILNTKLLELPNIYTSMYFSSRYNKNAKENLRGYIDVLKNKVRELEEEDKMISGK